MTMVIFTQISVLISDVTSQRLKQISRSTRLAKPLTPYIRGGELETHYSSQVLPTLPTRALMHLSYRWLDFQICFHPTSEEFQ